MKALIIGGGLAGPVCAMALKRAGIDSAVFETHDDEGAIDAGAYLTIAVNGIRALRAIDGQRLVLAAGFPTPSVEFVSAAGRYIGRSPAGPVLADGTTTHTVKHSDIYRAVRREAARRGIAIQYGKQLTAAAVTPGGGVVAQFADGSRSTGDLLIGADGVHSLVRTIIDPDAAAPRYNGFGAVGGFCPERVVGAPPGTSRMFYGRKCSFGYSIAPDGLPWWYANPPREREFPPGELSGAAAGEWQQRLVQEYALTDHPIVDIIRATPGKPAASNQYEIAPAVNWHNSAMVLVGDAAHAPSPASGQGASQAIEDAVFLAKCLRDAGAVPAALAAYARARRPRAEKVVIRGAKTGRAGLHSTARFPPPDDLLVNLIADSARSDYWRSQTWLFEYVIDW